MHPLLLPAKCDDEAPLSESPSEDCLRNMLPSPSESSVTKDCSLGSNVPLHSES